MTFDLRRYIGLAACSLVAFAAQLAAAQTPTVSGVSISSTPASGDTYQLAEVIEVRVTFDRNVTVLGEPLLALTIGSTTRQAGLSTSQEALLREDETVVIFVYVVQSSDSDVDGISVGSSALSLNGGMISNSDDDTASALSLGSHAISNSANHKVNGSIDAAPTVSQVRIRDKFSGDTFELAEVISIDVTFDRAVDVTGTPELTLGIGSITRRVSVNQNLLDELVNTLYFDYVVQSSDSDADGISIGSSALSLTGGTVRIRGGTSGASLSLGSHAISNSSNHKVDGSIETAPEVLNVFTSPAPARGDTYEQGEAIVVYMFFTRRVEVSGEPQMVLTIGSTTRYATYLGIESQSGWLRFRYVVQSSDRDADGFNTSALILNGGTIRIRGGATNALLDLGQRRTSLARYKVDGSRGTSSAPTEVRTETTATGLLVTWSAATGATSYKVQWRLAGEAWSSSRQEETTATRLELYGLAPGSYEVRVVAVMDGQDGAASGATAGEVAAPVNAAPLLAEELPALALDVGETKAVDLDSAFEDPNDDLLRYSASSDGGAVSVQVASGEARIRGIRPGEATVTVVATDPEGLSATTTFKVEVGALLSLSGSAAAPEGGEIVFTVTLSRALAEPLDFAWRTTPDGDAATAADASDYESAGTATIPAGRTTGTIEIAIVDDDDIEPAREHFVVELDEPENANVGFSRNTRAMAMIQEGVCDRTPAVRDELTRNWQGCHLPRPLGLARVPALNLAGRGIDALRPNDLLGLRGLLRLDLRGNALAVLPPALLAATPRLRTLDLSDNALETLPDGLFAGVEGLREVAVEGNPGAPFRLAVALVRTDAEPWAPGPATVSARAALGAPFAMVAPLVAMPAADESAVPPTVEIAAGETTGTSFAAESVGGASLALRPDAAPLPTSQCGGMPCFRGFEATAGSRLILFHRPPQALAAPTPQPLAGGDALRLSLDSLIAAGDAPDGMRWEASSSDESLATVRIVGTDLVVEPEPASEGRVEVALVATDALGFATTVRFEVQVEFHWPIGPARGWRSIFGGALPDAAATTE